MDTQADKWNPKDEPIYWFALLEKALDAGKLQEAVKAQCELEHLGYSVRYRRFKKSAKTTKPGQLAKAPVAFPFTPEELQVQARRLQSLPDDEIKLGLVHCLFVHCNAQSDSLKLAFRDLLGPDLERLKAFWGLRNGKELLAEQIAKNGGPR